MLLGVFAILVIGAAFLDLEPFSSNEMTQGSRPALTSTRPPQPSPTTHSTALLCSGGSNPISETNTRDEPFDTLDHTLQWLHVSQFCLQAKKKAEGGVCPCYDRPFTNHHTNLADFLFLFSIPSRSKQHRTPQYVNNPPRPISRPWKQSYKMMATIWSTTTQPENRSESTSQFYQRIPALTLTRFIICRFLK